MTSVPRWLLPLAAVLTMTAGEIRAVGGLTVSFPAARAAEDAWKPEFEDLCAKTQDAMALSADELRALVARCDKLLPAVEKLEASERKVYTRRLLACRNLYQFMLESR